MADRRYAASDVGAGVRERSVLKNVYIWMTLGLAITGVTALYISTNLNLVRALVGNPILFFGLIIGQLALVFTLSARIMALQASTATLIFAAYSILNGVTLSLIFLAYTGESIFLAFFVAGGMFAGMSLFAVTTKMDLSGLGHYLRMALIGLIVAMLVNFFLRSPGFDWLISIAGVALFAGLTAYDTQIIRRWSREMTDTSDEATYMKISILGALKLYLDFINLFLFLLRLLGRRR